MVALLGISLPTFFFATILKLVFSIKLDLLPLFGIVGRFTSSSTVWQLLDMGKHMIMPVMTLVIISIGGLMRYTPPICWKSMNSDYIRTARAKGLSENRVINYHAFRNTLIPIVTIVGGSLPGFCRRPDHGERCFKSLGSAIRPTRRWSAVIFPSRCFTWSLWPH